MGQSHVVKNHVDLYLEYIDKDNLYGPKGLDTMPLESRVFWAFFRVVCKCSRKPLPFFHNMPLLGLFKDSRDSVAIDSNLLIILSMFECSKHDQYAWFNDSRNKILLMMRYYENLKDDRGFVTQGAYSDWQDSQKRTGVTFLTNLMYYEVCKRLTTRGIDILTSKQLRDVQLRLCEVFRIGKDGLFRSTESGEQVSLEGNLFAIKWNFLETHQTTGLWRALVKHELWRGIADTETFSRTDCLCCVNCLLPPRDTGFPGFVTYPNYRAGEAAMQVRYGGLQSYHDTMYWSWLMAFSGEVAYRMGDIGEGDRIASNLWRLSERDGTICEIYAHEPEFPPFKSIAVVAEQPFSWGSSFVLSMLEARHLATTGHVETM
jgi:hypothetical protein